MSSLSGLENFKPCSGDGEFLGADAQEFVIPKEFDLGFTDGDHGEGVFPTARQNGRAQIIGI
jgi:hypothetical protein